MSRSLARTAVLAALTLALAGSTAVAASAASDVPVPGTSECTNLVNDQVDVVLARQVVAADQVTLDTALRANPVVDATVNAARAKLATDQANLANIVISVTRSLCPGIPVTTTAPTTTTTTPAETTSPPVVSGPRIIVLPQTTVLTSKTVIATQDDGSVATTSGSQVTEVPSGSASTGAA